MSLSSRFSKIRTEGIESGDEIEKEDVECLTKLMGNRFRYSNPSSLTFSLGRHDTILSDGDKTASEDELEMDSNWVADFQNALRKDNLGTSDKETIEQDDSCQSNTVLHVEPSSKHGCLVDDTEPVTKCRANKHGSLDSDQNGKETAKQPASEVVKIETKATAQQNKTLKTDSNDSITKVELAQTANNFSHEAEKSNISNSEAKLENNCVNLPNSRAERRDARINELKDKIKILNDKLTLKETEKSQKKAKKTVKRKNDTSCNEKVEKDVKKSDNVMLSSHDKTESNKIRCESIIKFKKISECLSKEVGASESEEKSECLDKEVNAKSTEINPKEWNSNEEADKPKTGVKLNKVDQLKTGAKLKKEIDQPKTVVKSNNEVDQLKSGVKLNKEVDQPKTGVKPNKKIDQSKTGGKLNKKIDQSKTGGKLNKEIDQPKTAEKSNKEMDHPKTGGKLNKEMDQPKTSVAATTKAKELLVKKTKSFNIKSACSFPLDDLLPTDKPLDKPVVNISNKSDNNREKSNVSQPKLCTIPKYVPERVTVSESGFWPQAPAQPAIYVDNQFHGTIYSGDFAYTNCNPGYNQFPPSDYSHSLPMGNETITRPDNVTQSFLSHNPFQNSGYNEITSQCERTPVTPTPLVQSNDHLNSLLLAMKYGNHMAIQKLQAALSEQITKTRQISPDIYASNQGLCNEHQNFGFYKERSNLNNSNSSENTSPKQQSEQLFHLFVEQVSGLVKTKEDKDKVKSLLEVLKKESGDRLTGTGFTPPDVERTPSCEIIHEPSVDECKTDGLELFEGRTLLKGGVKPRHIPKTTIHKNEKGLSPKDPRTFPPKPQTAVKLKLPEFHSTVWVTNESETKEYNIPYNAKDPRCRKLLSEEPEKLNINTDKTLTNGKQNTATSETDALEKVVHVLESLKQLEKQLLEKRKASDDELSSTSIVSKELPTYSNDNHKEEVSVVKESAPLKSIPVIIGQSQHGSSKIGVKQRPSMLQDIKTVDLIANVNAAEKKAIRPFEKVKETKPSIGIVIPVQIQAKRNKKDAESETEEGQILSSQENKRMKSIEKTVKMTREKTEIASEAAHKLINISYSDISDLDDSGETAVKDTISADKKTELGRENKRNEIKSIYKKSDPKDKSRSPEKHREHYRSRNYRQRERSSSERFSRSPSSHSTCQRSPCTNSRDRWDTNKQFSRSPSSHSTFQRSPCSNSRDRWDTNNKRNDPSTDRSRYTSDRREDSYNRNKYRRDHRSTSVEKSQKIIRGNEIPKRSRDSSVDTCCLVTVQTRKRHHTTREDSFNREEKIARIENENRRLSHGNDVREKLGSRSDDLRSLVSELKKTSKISRDGQSPAINPLTTSERFYNTNTLTEVVGPKIHYEHDLKTEDEMNLSDDEIKKEYMEKFTITEHVMKTPTGSIVPQGGGSVLRGSVHVKKTTPYKPTSTKSAKQLKQEEEDRLFLENCKKKIDLFDKISPEFTGSVKRPGDSVTPTKPTGEQMDKKRGGLSYGDMLQLADLEEGQLY